METNDLLKSTLKDESRQRKGDTKSCLFCGLNHCFIPSVPGTTWGWETVHQCKPYPQHIDRHTQVVKEVKERDEHDNIQVREVVTRSLESGQPDDDIDVEKFGNSTSFVKP